MSAVNLSVPRWQPPQVQVLSRMDERDPATLRAALAQLDVAHALRYRPEGATTWCNIFVADGLLALGLPYWLHWVQSDNTPHVGLPPRAAQAACVELNANRMCDWLWLHGTRFGWYRVDLCAASERSARGRPVVAAWKNPVPTRAGHVALLLPPCGAEIRIAQAGARCLWDVPLEAGFGLLAPSVSFYAHP
jgi:hypothetical protein